MIWLCIGLGLIAGSFAGVVVSRVPTGRKWWEGRSKCDQCGQQLNWWELIPVLSFVVQMGKCRHCGKRIAWTVVGIELAMAIGFGAIYSWIGFGWQSLSVMAMWWVSMVVLFMDVQTKLVSEMLMVMWGGLVVIGNWTNWGNWANWEGLILGVALIGGVWAVTAGKGMGFGDVEIAAVLGWWLGWQLMGLTLWLAFVSGGVVGLVLLSVNRVGMKSEIPFGPFLILAGWISWWWGKGIIDFVLGRYV